MPNLNSAPKSIHIRVSAHQIEGGTSVFYGIGCRSDKNASNIYMFLIRNNRAYIYKFLDGSPRKLASSLVYATGTIQLAATCAGVEGQIAAHLAFWVNGHKVAQATDRTPITKGTVGLVVDIVAGTTGASAVRFDDFVVARG